MRRQRAQIQIISHQPEDRRSQHLVRTTSNTRIPPMNTSSVLLLLLVVASFASASPIKTHYPPGLAETPMPFDNKNNDFPQEQRDANGSTTSSRLVSRLDDDPTPRLRQQKSTRKLMGTGAKIGTGVGTSAGAIIIAALAFCIYRKKQKISKQHHVKKEGTFDANDDYAMEHQHDSGGKDDNSDTTSSLEGGDDDDDDNGHDSKNHTCNHNCRHHSQRVNSAVVGVSSSGTDNDKDLILDDNDNDDDDREYDGKRLFGNGYGLSHASSVASQHSISSVRNGATNSLDVHKCASFSCELCRKNREPSFVVIPPVVPKLEPLPERWWEKDDEIAPVPKIVNGGLGSVSYDTNDCLGGTCSHHGGDDDDDDDEEEDYEEEGTEVDEQSFVAHQKSNPARSYPGTSPSGSYPEMNRSRSYLDKIPSGSFSDDDSSDDNDDSYREV